MILLKQFVEEMEYQKKGVSYCAICDGPLPMFRNKPMVVVGGGDAALEEGGFLTKYASKVYLVHRRNEFRASPIVQEHAKKNPKIDFRMDSVLDEVGGGEFVEWAKIKNLKTGEIEQVSVGAVFIFIGFKPNSDMVKGTVLKDNAGHIMTDQFMHTSIPGLFAIGDVRQQLTKQVTNAVGDGTTAAVAAGKYLEDNLPEPIGLETLRGRM
jgi:thioredoxin reductase (NADPH)